MTLRNARCSWPSRRGREVADQRLQDNESRSVTLWLCAAGLCPPITWVKTTSGPEMPFCSCRVDAKRGGFYRYRDRVPVEVVPLGVAENLADALEAIVPTWAISAHKALAEFRAAYPVRREEGQG